MSKAKMQAARDLIREGKIEEARALLGTVDHPKAREWLVRLDAQEKAEATPPKAKGRTRKRDIAIAAGIIFVIAFVALIGGGDGEDEGEMAVPTMTDAPAPTATVIPTVTASTTITPSATITETPVPTNAPTATRRPEGVLADNLTLVYEDVEGVDSVAIVGVEFGNRENVDFLVTAEVRVMRGFNTEAMANTLRQFAHAELVSARLDYSVILYDDQGAADYVWSNREDAWQITELPLPDELLATVEA